LKNYLERKKTLKMLLKNQYIFDKKHKMPKLEFLKCFLSYEVDQISLI